MLLHVRVDAGSIEANSNSNGVFVCWPRCVVFGIEVTSLVVYVLIDVVSR